MTRLLIDGQWCLVDAVDRPRVEPHRWFLMNGYAYAVWGVAPKQFLMPMHRLVVNATKGKVVDHINGHRLDNRRFNLRLVTVSENSANKKRYHGVHWHPAAQQWAVVVEWSDNGAPHYCYVGHFATPKMGAMHYDAAVQRLGLFGSGVPTNGFIATGVLRD